MNKAIATGDLTSCDKEPIHVPGTIQPTGALLVLDQAEWRITHASSNCEEFLSIKSDRLIGQTLSVALGREVSHRMANALTTSLGPMLPGRAFGLEIGNGKLFNAAIHVHDGRTLLEFEHAIASRDDSLPLLLVRTMLTRLQEAQSTLQACEAVVEQLWTLIGFDRVMVYQFMHDGSGWVIAEKRRAGVESFLGHHYPASDIPVQARALYLKNWIRTIADVDATPVPILPILRANERSIDLSYCNLRSVSPIHLEYLRNMKVGASMSISIVIGGKLWGLIACHHAVPRALAAETRVAAELFGQAFSLQLQAIERQDATQVLRDARARLDQLVAAIPSDGSLLESLSSRLPEIANLLPADGVGLWIGGEWRGHGITPPIDALPALADALVVAAGGEVYATHELFTLVPEAIAYAELVSGVLSVPLSRAPGDYLLFFRRQFIHAIEWAGNPSKPYSNGEERLSPRKSFQIWKQEVRNTSRVWEASDRLTAEALRIALFEVVFRFSEAIAQQKAKTAEQQRLFVAELNHRVKNVLALVNALVKQSYGSHDNISVFVSDLEGRILSLAKAHDQANSVGAHDLRGLIETELAPFRASSTRSITIEGPPMALDARSFAVLALVFHEMTTNAAKHGALSVLNGGIDVRWAVDTEGNCNLSWREFNGPPTRPLTRTGFGSKLIERQIPFELGGEVEVEYGPDGVRVFIKIPAQNVNFRSKVRAQDDPSLAMPGSVPDNVVTGLSVLLVEDSLMVAMQTEDALRKAGAAAITVCSTNQHALMYLGANRPDVAILDVNLSGGTSLPIADALIGANVPFIIATGYGERAEISQLFGNAPILGSPLFQVGSLRSSLPAMR